MNANIFTCDQFAIMYIYVSNQFRLEDFSNRLNLRHVKRRVAALFFGLDDSPDPYLSSF